MQAAVMSYCLRGALPEDQRSMEEIVKLAAKEEIFCLEIYTGGWDVDGDMCKAAEGLKALAEDLGISMPVMGSGTRLGHIDASRGKNMAQLKAEVETCAILGGTVMTLPIVDGQPVPTNKPSAIVGLRFEQMLPELVAQLQELADYAKTFQVELAVLNHCFLVYLGWHQKWLTLLSERDNVGACVDPGNYLHYGHQDPEPVCRELGRLTKMVRAGNVLPKLDEDVIAQFKRDGQFQPWQAVSFDEGMIDQVACYQALSDGGYDGVVSLKTAGTHPNGSLDAIRHSWQSLNKALKQIK
jgi:sugar phosphate isomerase/epimerase